MTKGPSTVQYEATAGQKRHPGAASGQTGSRNMAEICSIDFPTPISYSTSNTLGGISLTIKALLRGDGQQYVNARSTRHSMFVMKPEVEIWPRVGIETPTAPTQVTGSRKMSVHTEIDLRHTIRYDTIR